MNLQTILEEIKIKLTGGILELEVSDDALTKVINTCIREINRYYNSTKYVTLPFSQCIDFSNLLTSDEEEYSLDVSSVVNVYRTSGTTSIDSSSPMSDPLALAQWQVLNSGTGNYPYMQDYVYDYMAYATALRIRNTLSTDLSFFYDKYENKLYINTSASVPTTITVEYVPRLTSVEDFKSDYWIDILVRMAVAQTKIVLGRVRSRYRQSNALIEGDGQEVLTEGLQEYESIVEHLKANSDVGEPID